MLWWTKRLLNSDNPETRAKAIRSLVKNGSPQAIDILLQKLGDRSESKNARITVAVALGSLNDGNPAYATVVSALEAVLAEPSYDLRWGALRGLKDLGWEPTTASQRAIVAVNDGQWAEVETLGDAVFDAVVTALGGSDHMRRDSAVSRLGEMRDGRAVAPLAALLGSREDNLRSCVVLALGKIAHADAIPSLVAALDNDSSMDVRKYAADALGKIGGGGVIEPLIGALGDKDSLVARYAEQSLQQLGWEEMPELVNLSKSDTLQKGEVVSHLVAALKGRGAMGSKLVAAFVRRLLICRSADIIWFLGIAAKMDPSPELVSALRSVSESSATRPGSAGWFTPEIVGAGKIGWTEGTHSKVTEMARKALAGLESSTL